MKKILLLASLTLILSGCSFSQLPNQQQPGVPLPQQKEINPVDTKAKTSAESQLPKSIFQKCNVSKSLSLKPAKNYSMLGDDEFDTAVCAYLVKETVNVPFTEDGSKQINAYLNVLEFADNKFKESVLKTISEEGNTVNQASGQVVKLNVGCVEKGTITGISYQTDPYVDAETMNAILNSSVEKPIPIILSFGIHDGRGCNCCNLMHKIRLIK